MKMTWIPYQYRLLMDEYDRHNLAGNVRTQKIENLEKIKRKKLDGLRKIHVPQVGFKEILQKELNKGDHILQSFPIQIQFDPLNNTYVGSAIDFAVEIDGDTVDEVIDQVRKKIKDTINLYREQGKSIPTPSNIVDINIYYVPVIHS